MSVGAVCLLSGCSSDEPILQNGGDNVCFTVKIPENLATRAFGDAGTGEGAPDSNHLVCSVFDTAGEFVTSVDIPDAFSAGLTQTVELQLVKNQEYDVLFWAYNDQAAGAPYTYTASTGELEIDYSKVKANDESYDAFYSLEHAVADGGTYVVELKRPFAQINFGSSDLSNPAVQAVLPHVSSTLTVTSGLYKSVNLLTATPGDEVQEPVAFSVSPIPTPLEEGSMFPVDGYQNIQMNYLLVGVPGGAMAQKSLIDATFALDNNGSEINNLQLASIPVRCNYRTNIFGNLLTTVNSFGVTIVPAFDGNYPIDRSGEVKTISDLNSMLAKGEKTQFIVTGPVGGSDNVITIPADSDNKNYTIRFENIEDDAFIRIGSDYKGARSSVTVSTPVGSKADFEVDTPSIPVVMNGGYGTVSSSASKTTVGENSSMERLNVQNGTVAVMGTLDNISRTADNPTVTKTAVIVYEGGVLTNDPATGERIHVVTFPLFSGGSGTASDPYKMTKAKDLQDILYLYLGKETDSWYRTPMMMENDIDMTTEEPMRNLGVSSMLLDGQGHTLTMNFTSESTEGVAATVGLFANFNGAGNDFIREASAAEKDSPYAYTLPFNGKTYIITGGCIRNLVLRGTVYSDNNGAVSPLGGSQNTGYVIDVTSHVDVTAKGSAYFVAGIISGTRGTGLVIGCKNYGTITAESPTGVVGGITAQLYGGSACNGSYPDILAPYSASVYGCANYGTIISGGKDVGGIVGQTHGYGGPRGIIDCINAGNISGANNVGGILGRHSSTGGDLMLSGDTNTGTITSSGIWGDICGLAEGSFMEGSQK